MPPPRSFFLPKMTKAIDFTGEEVQNKDESIMQTSAWDYEESKKTRPVNSTQKSAE